MSRRRKSRHFPVLLALPVVLLAAFLFFLMQDIPAPQQAIVKDIPYESLQQK